MGDREGGQAVEDGHPHLISVIDSPGHVDFCSEVPSQDIFMTVLYSGHDCLIL
jgi:predicted membrane GTPase involved in stress response